MRQASYPIVWAFSLIAEPASLAGGRELIGESAREAGFAEERVFDIRVACSEAMANAIEHAPIKNHIQVTMYLYRDRLEIQVEDPGEFQVPYRPELHPHRGLGLPLMAKLADHLALYSGPRGGTLVTLTFYRPGGERKETDILPPSIRKLVEENELFAAITEHAPVGIYVLSPDLRFRWANQTYLAFLDEPYRSGDLVGSHFADVVPGAREVGLIAGLQEASNTGKQVASEHELSGFSRGMTWWRRTVVPLKGDKGVGPYDLLVVVSDETEQMRTQQALRESERDLHRAQEVGHIGWWRLDTRRDVLTWSDENYRIFGVPEGTPLSYESFLETIHPDDRGYVDEQWNAGLRGEPYDVEHRVISAGRVKWVKEKAYLEFDDEGRLLGGFGITQDITERRRAEEALRLSLERQALAQRAAKTGFWDWDVVSGHLSWSPELFDLLGLDPAFEPTFDVWLSAIHPEDRERALENVNRSIKERVALDQEYRIRLPDGQERWISALGDATYSSDGQPLRMSGICLDVTERKRAEVEHEQLLAQEQAVAAGAYARSLIEAALDPLVTISPEGKITDVNEATVKVTGRARDELIGTDFSDYFTDPESARQGYREVFDKGSVTDYPLTIRDRNGKLTDVLYNASLYRDKQGKVVGVFAAARDVTVLQELEEQRSLVGKLQDTLVDVLRESSGLRFGHLYRSATRGARIGGDFYDTFELKNGLFVVLIGDVSGHGVEAARLATLVKDVLNAFSRQSQHPGRVLQETNDLLIERCTQGFATVFLGMLDPTTETLVYSSAGHPNALLRSKSGEIALLEAASAPLGVFPTYSWKECQASFGKKDLLFVYTDGAIEARRDGDFFGQERLVEALKHWSDLSPERLPERVMDEVLAFSGGELADDVALLALQLTEAAGSNRAPEGWPKEKLLG